MIQLKQQKQWKTLVNNQLNYYGFISMHAFLVIKVERVSNEDTEEGYIFPDEDDELTDYIGGNVQLMVPVGVLQDISKQNYT